MELIKCHHLERGKSHLQWNRQLKTVFTQCSLILPLLPCRASSSTVRLSTDCFKRFLRRRPWRTVSAVLIHSHWVCEGQGEWETLRLKVKHYISAKIEWRNSLNTVPCVCVCCSIHLRTAEGSLVSRETLCFKELFVLPLLHAADSDQGNVHEPPRVNPLKLFLSALDTLTPVWVSLCCLSSSVSFCCCLVFFLFSKLFIFFKKEEKSVSSSVNFVTTNM